jgi:uncharacterized protein YbaP (TraB family)
MIRHFALVLAVLLPVACGQPQTPAAGQASPAASPAAAPALREPGLPMWVIRDADSTIYLTGTVHMLPPDVKWKNARLEAALDEATELWLEIAMPANVDEFRRQAGPIIERHAMSDGPPLTSRLSDSERRALVEALQRAGLPPEAMTRVDRMKPWYVTQTIAAAPRAEAGFSPDAGIDIALAGMARAQSVEIKGLVTIEEQAAILSPAPEEDQLLQLRMLLRAPPWALGFSTWMGGQTFRAWAAGNTLPVELLISTMSLGGEGPQRNQVDALLKNRNANWAGQIEEMLNGSGVSFIAVGAGHLVGPDSVQNHLAARGITAERY